MKFGKPAYDSVNKLYKCEVMEGFRCETRVESSTFTPALDSFLPALRKEVSEAIISLTKGWFSKPLELQYVSERLAFSFPALEIPQDFDGTLAWRAITLIISKTTFTFLFELVEKKESEKVMIEFPDEEEESQHKARQVPSDRAKHKELVLKERERAARYLFRAERLTQEYCQLYGDDTDWDEESDEDSDESI
jgi:hypothetical protein